MTHHGRTPFAAFERLCKKLQPTPMGGKLKHRTSSSREAAPAKPKLSCTCSQPPLPQTRLLACLLSCIESREGGPHCALCSSASDVTGGAPVSHMFKWLPKAFRRLALGLWRRWMDFGNQLSRACLALAPGWVDGSRCQELEKCQKKLQRAPVRHARRAARSALGKVRGCWKLVCCVEAWRS